MEEIEQTNKWSYSTSGKRIRGFFCMLTFCVCTASAVFAMYGIARYGTGIIFDLTGSYYESQTFQTDITNEVGSLLNDVYYANYYSPEDSISIMDASTGVKRYYDIKTVISAIEEGDLQFYNSEGLISRDISFVEYKDLQGTDANGKKADFADYYTALSYVNSDLPEEAFLSLDKNGFKRLFQTTGMKNTNYRFSTQFSASSYFLFCTESQSIDQVLQSIENEEPDSENPYDISGMQYAVYDSKRDLFYSTWDDYFEPGDRYTYRVAELAAVIKEYNYTPQKINSIVIPMLRSYNYGTNSLTQYIRTQYEAMVDAERNLEARADSGVLYYIENSRLKESNVEDWHTITSQKYKYYMARDPAAALEKENGTEPVKALRNYSVMESEFSVFPLDTIFYFGIDEDKAVKGSGDIARNSRDYKLLTRGAKYSIIVAVIAALLLIWQAVRLIYTTGRRERGDKQVALNRYDELPTEIWLALYIGILGTTSMLAWTAASYIVNLNTDLYQVILMAILESVPFAFFFMILTLSFARRLKSHNLWNRLYIRQLVTRCGEAVKEFYYNRKGTERFFVAFAGYVVIEIISIFMIFTSGYAQIMLIGMILFAGIQIKACVVVLHIIKDIKSLIHGAQEITKGDLDYKVRVKENTSLFEELSEGINHIGDGLKAAVETSVKDERMKTELITNVSHDLKTPLTSIINYINLLKTQKMPTKEAEHYIEVLDSKALRLKQLTEDLVEAAKVNTGNIELENMPLAFDELMKQAIGEFEDKFEMKNLTVITHYTEEPAVILADGRRMYRIIENILQNAYKYALSGTRIYADLSNNQSIITFTLKNISATPLNISADELMERFTRGDSARTTEGSGLGLSIARDLARLQNGTFDILLDGDLFKVILTFPEYKKTEDEDI